MLEEYLARKKRRKTIGCFIVPLIVLAGLGGAFFAFRIYCSGRVQAELDAIAEAGYPVTLEGLNAWYPEPAGENAADTYLAAFAKAKSIGPPDELAEKLPIVGGGKLPAAGERLPDEMREAIEQYLQANEEALELLHEAAGIEECRYPLDMTQGAPIMLPHLGQARKCARLLTLETLYDACKGNGERATESVDASLALARSLNNEPLMISQLVRIACHAIAIDSLERALSRIPLPEDRVSALATALRQAENPEAMTRAIVSQRCSGSWLFSMRPSDQAALLSQSAGSSAATTMVWFHRLTGLQDLDHAAFLKIMREVIEASEKPPPERFQAMRAIKLGSRVKNLPWYCIVTKMMAPPFDRAAEVDVMNIASLRAARTALAVERYRRTRGPLPEKLDNLVPEFMDAIPIDPFDGNPLRYKKLEEGYVVYSIGPDGDDDGGKEREPGGGDDHDVTFTVER